MKKITLAAISILFCAGSTFAQEPPPLHQVAQTLDQLKQHALVSGFRAGLVSPGITVVTPLDAKQASTSPEVELLDEKYRAVARRVLETSAIVGTVRVRFVRARDEGAGFVHELSHSEGRRLLAFTGLLTDVVLNTQRTTPKQRAAHLFTSAVIPFMAFAAKAANNTDLADFGVAVTYLARDFSNSYAQGNGETLLAIVPRDELDKFVAGDLTDQELADASSVWTTALSGGGFSKVAVHLD